MLKQFVGSLRTCASSYAVVVFRRESLHRIGGKRSSKMTFTDRSL